MTTTRKETPQELHDRLCRLPDPFAVARVRPLPPRKKHLDEMYERFLNLMIYRGGRYTSSNILTYQSGPYWAKRCIEEGLQRGDLVRSGKGRYTFIYGSFVPQTPDAIRATLTQIEEAIAGGQACGDVCFRYGITPEILDSWRRDHGRKLTEGAPQGEPATADDPDLLAKLEAQTAEIERLRNVVLQLGGTV